MLAEGDDLLVALQSGRLVVTEVLPEPALHEPGLGLMGCHLEDAVEKDLGDVPALIGDRLSGIPAIYADRGVGLAGWISLRPTIGVKACEPPHQSKVIIHKY